MSAALCPCCHGPARVDRENMRLQLRYLAHAVMAAHHDENMDEEDYLALGSFLYDLADRIFPQPDDSDKR
ncbi:hypothetical protein LJC15_01020 [Desulfovibrio sp. OttesenSCG-928-G11]|nr:hypothetical protein [Desulfovibrio sp. OttesenSCG-928-G11]